MYLDYGLAWLIRRQQNVDLLREAEQYSLVRLTLAGQPAQILVPTRALAWLGRRLVVWGQRLEERYSTLLEAPPLSATGHGR